MSTIADLNFYIIVCSSIGFLIAAYSYYVKVKFLKNPKKYKAFCDLSDKISCSKVVTSEYGSGFGIIGKLFGENSSINVSNSILGGVFYALQIVLTFYNYNNLIQQVALGTSALSVIGSIYLAYILYFVLKDLCIVCILSYVVNGFLLYFNWSIYMTELS